MKNFAKAIAYMVAVTLPVAMICAPLLFEPPSQAIAQGAPFNAYSVATLGGNCASQGSVLFQSNNGISKCLGAGANGQVLQSGGPGADVHWLTTSGTGTVTSVAATVPAYMTIGGTPITAAGTLAFGFGNETTNLVFAAPNGSTGAPSFRALASADIPAINLAASGAGGVTGTLPGANMSATNLAASGNGGVTGILPIANGGSGEATGAANLVFANPNGSSGAPSFRALVGADIPAINVAASGNGGITGTVANGNLPAINLAASGGGGVTGILPIANGGTSSSSLGSGLSQGSATLTAWTGGRNRIINGAMDLDQRHEGAAQTIIAGAALAYTVDQFWAASTGANVTGQRVANTGTAASPSQSAYQFTGAASVTGIQFGQRMRSASTYDLANTNATFSVTLANSLLTTVTWTAYRANTPDTFGTLASPTKTQIGTGTFTVTSTPTRYSATIAVPAAATTGIEIILSVGAQTSGTWTIGNEQFEPGSVATNYEYRPIELVLDQAQTWYEKSYDAGFVAGGLSSNGASYITIGGLNVATNTGGQNVYYKTRKFGSVTIGGYSPITGSLGKARDLLNNADTNATITLSGVNGFSWSAVNSSAASGVSFDMQWTAESDIP